MNVSGQSNISYHSVKEEFFLSYVNTKDNEGSKGWRMCTRNWSVPPMSCKTKSPSEGVEPTVYEIS
jgi:hypothetical protein